MYFLLLILTSITLTELIITVMSENVNKYLQTNLINLLTSENVNKYLQTNLINLLTFSALRNFSIIFYIFHTYEEIYKLR